MEQDGQFYYLRFIKAGEDTLRKVSAKGEIRAMETIRDALEDGWILVCIEGEEPSTFMPPLK